MIKLMGLFLVITGCSSAISGQLMSEEGKPIVLKDSRVNIVRLDGEKQKSVEIATTNESGTFNTKSALSNGSYLVEALVPGFKPSSIRITLKGSENVVLKLQPLPPGDLGTIDYNEGLPLGQGIGGAQIMPPNM